MSAGAVKRKRNWNNINRGKWPDHWCSVCNTPQSTFFLKCRSCGSWMRDCTREPKIHYAKKTKA